MERLFHASAARVVEQRSATRSEAAKRSSANVREAKLRERSRSTAKLPVAKLHAALSYGQGHMASSGFLLCTESFSLDEVKLLGAVKFLMRNSGVECSAHFIIEGLVIGLRSAMTKGHLSILRPVRWSGFFCSLVSPSFHPG